MARDYIITQTPVHSTSIVKESLMEDIDITITGEQLKKGSTRMEKECGMQTIDYII